MTRDTVILEKETFSFLLFSTFGAHRGVAGYPLGTKRSSDAGPSSKHAPFWRD